MTESRRIILNTLASYGRAVFAMFVGVFSSRWLLMGLGAEDLGLQCVVGSLIGAIVIFETVMQVAVARFYAFAIGKAQVMDEEEGRDEICRWFNVVFLIHLALPLLIMIFGYPLGLYAVRHWLTIPAARMGACVFVFKCSMVVAFISMVSTPYIAMYQARQLIVELSLFGVLRTVMNFGFTFSLLYVTCDRLEYSGLFSAIVALGVLGAQMYRGWRHFPECRVRAEYLFDMSRFRRIFTYFGCEFYSCFGAMFMNQGSSIVVNRFFGPQVNAAKSIATTLSNQAMSLSNSLIGAFLPAVTTKAGTGESEKSEGLASRSSKFGTLLILLFSVPLIAEMDEVLHLWLVDPPQYTNQFCICILVAQVVEKLGIGHHVLISAYGRVGVYHIVVGSTIVMSVPILFTLIALDVGPVAIGYMYVIVNTFVCVERWFLARWLVGMPILTYLCKSLIPVLVAAVFAQGSAWICTYCVAPSFGRICLTSLMSTIVLLLISFEWVLDREEKEIVIHAVRRFVHR